MLRDFRIPPLMGGEAARAIIFLHGLGDRGDGGLLSLGEAWQRSLPDCEFLCPDAPFAFEHAPPDFGGRQWFSLDDFSQDAMQAGIERAAPFLEKYIDHILTTRKLTANKLALVGFSQGTMMALYVAPRRAESLACVVGYSGLLVGGAALKRDIRSKPPVLLLHGKMDDVVPFAAMEDAARQLKAAGIEAETRALPLTGHTIDDTGVRIGLNFIEKCWRS